MQNFYDLPLGMPKQREFILFKVIIIIESEYINEE
jgi:hypothetical protein